MRYCPLLLASTAYGHRGESDRGVIGSMVGTLFLRDAMENQRVVALSSHTSLLSRSEPALNCMTHVCVSHTPRVYAD